jgi:hypothetical protein
VIAEDAQAVSENAAVWNKKWARNGQGLSPIVLGKVNGVVAGNHYEG